MKKILLSLLLAVFSLTMFAQTDGTGAGWTPIRKKQNMKDSTYFSVAPVYKAGQAAEVEDVAVMLLPDTVQHTINYTLGAADVNTEQMCLKATSIVITVPVNFSDMPVGSNINFWGEGAGIMVFKKAGGVTFISNNDSIATARKGQVVGLKKIATNTYFLYGELSD